MYCIGNEIPDGSTASGPATGPGRWPSRCGRSTTPASSPRRSTGHARRRPAAVRRRCGTPRRRRRSPRTRASTRRRRPSATLMGDGHAGRAGRRGQDWRGVLVPRRRRLQLHGDRASRWTRELHPAAGHRRQRDPPADDRRGLGGWCSSTRNVIGDFTWTGWDYLGEAGIGRIEYGEPAGDWASAPSTATYPWLTAWCGDIDITGHRRPQSYYREIVFGLPDRPVPRRAAARAPRRGGRRTRVRGRGPTWSSSWSWAGPRGRAGHRRGLRRRRRGRAAGERHVRSVGSRRCEAPLPGRVRDDLPAGRARGGRLARRRRRSAA